MRKLFPCIDGPRLKMCKSFLNISLQRLGKIPHVNIIMFYLKQVNEMLKGLYMFLSCKVFRFSIKLRKVLVVFCRKIMKDMTQVKWSILILGIGRNIVMWKGCNLDFGVVRFTGLFFNVMCFRPMVLIKIIFTGWRDTLSF